jgi:hypothetical protein
VGDERDSPPRRGGIAPAKAVLDRYLRNTGLGARLRDNSVFKAWRDALGPTMAARAKALSFERGELHVAVRSAAHLQELTSFTGEGYRLKANQRLGSERIRSVVFRLER